MPSLITEGPFTGYARAGYQVILADPPWTFVTRSLKNQDRLPGYRVMTLDDIKALPVKQLAAKNCVLFMWVIDSHLKLAMEVVEAWGFKYKTVGFYWEKINKDGSPFTGMGFWTRANPEQCWALQDSEDEQCLLATTGQPKRVSRSVSRLIQAPRREHSRKPDETFERIEALCSGPYLELFARQRKPGWATWGNETGYFPATVDEKVAALKNSGLYSRGDEAILSSLSSDLEALI